MRFTKMHGAGNDYLFVDVRKTAPPADPGQLARTMSNRQTGIGADGLILIHQSSQADARMQVFNADGSEAGMCGNGLRCVAKYVIEHPLDDRNTRKSPTSTLEIETGDRVVQVEVALRDAEVVQARVNMGSPVFAPSGIPTTLPGEPPLNLLLHLRSLETTDDQWTSQHPGLPEEVIVSSLSMGNPHCVVFCEELTDTHVLGLGPVLENHSHFPERTNVEFVQFLSRNEINMRVWERGSGETLACGSGACAAVIAAILMRRCDESVLVRMPGGDLQVEWREWGDVYLTGPVTEVFQGDWQSDTAA